MLLFVVLVGPTYCSAFSDSRFISFCHLRSNWFQFKCWQVNRSHVKTFSLLSEMIGVSAPLSRFSTQIHIVKTWETVSLWGCRSTKPGSHQGDDDACNYKKITQILSVDKAVLSVEMCVLPAFWLAPVMMNCSCSSSSMKSSGAL